MEFKAFELFIAVVFLVCLLYILYDNRCKHEYEHVFSFRIGTKTYVRYVCRKCNVTREVMLDE